MPTKNRTKREAAPPKDYILGIPDSELEPRFRNQMHEHILNSLAGFRDVTLNTPSLFGMWELEMTCDRNPPAITADEVERTLRDAIGNRQFGLQVDRMVTVVLNGRIKSRFFLSG